MNSENIDAIEEKHWNTIESLKQLDSDSLWDSVTVLRHAGSQPTFQKAYQWCTDPDPFRRSIGILILAQFGPDLKAYPEETAAIIGSMILDEEDTEVITSLISAVYYRELHDKTDWLVSLSDHSDQDVRWTVAWALPIPKCSDQTAYQSSIDALLKLMKDKESNVRDWATFSISMTEQDTPEIRAALLERLSDKDFDTRSEAAIGLARRKEQKGIELLIQYLRSDRVGELYVEAAELYADTRLKPALLKLKKWWDVDPELLDRAIQACS